MMRIPIIFILLILTYNISSGQDVQSDSIIRKNNVMEVITHIYKNDNSKDSILYTVEKFNVFGKRLSISINNLRNGFIEYQYAYTYDSILSEQKQFNSYQKLSQIQRFFYNNQSKLFKAIHFDSLDKETGSYSEYKYNGKNQLTERKFFIDNLLFRHVKYVYHKNGKLKSEITLLPKNEKTILKFNIDGQMIPNRKARLYYLESKLNKKSPEDPDIIKKTHKFNKQLTIISLKGYLVVRKYDTLDTFIHYQKDGLIIHEIQYLNSKFLAKKRYQYHYFR
ncbi:MAG: hypothetical protein IPH57_10660 [Saprospiraceae bacterium]|nr:hypothetical protein [Saprospiraceae bacterium]